MQQRGGPRYGQQNCFPQTFSQKPQGMNSNWYSTAQFVNRAKQTALQQTGNHQLAALFNNPGGYNHNTMGGGGVSNGSGTMPSDGFMRLPFSSVRMVGPGQGQQIGGKSGCNCPNCSGPAGGNSFQAPGPMMGPQQNDSGRGNAVMTFTSQLTGLPIPEHPSGLFPNIDFVMVPANGNGNGGPDCGCGQPTPMPNFMGGVNNQQQQQMNNNMNMNNQHFGWNGNNNGNNCGGNVCFGGNGMQMNSLF